MGGIELSDVIEAYYSCRRRKRSTVNARRFELNWEAECVSLWEDINNGTYKPRRSIAFIVDKPKPREIFAADFRDRVVHHLLIGRIYPLLEKQFILDSYSTQKDKGTLFGVRRVEQMMRECSENYTRDCYVLKIDIQSFFMNIPRQRLYECLEHFMQEKYHGNDRETLMWLFRETLFNRCEHGCVIRCPRRKWKVLPPGKSLMRSDGTHGLPIGNLTSQMMALLYLDELDHNVTEQWGIRYYGRYVDDMVLMDLSKQKLLQVNGLIREWLRSRGLSLHPNKLYLQHYGKGVLFVGGMVLPGRKYVSRRTMTNCLHTIRRLNVCAGCDDADREQYREAFRATLNSYLGMFRHYDSLRFGKRVCGIIARSWYKKMYVKVRGRKMKVVLRKSDNSENTLLRKGILSVNDRERVDRATA